MQKFEKIKADRIESLEWQKESIEEKITELKNLTLESFIAKKIRKMDDNRTYNLSLGAEEPWDFIPTEGYIRMFDYDKLFEIGKLWFSQEVDEED